MTVTLITTMQRFAGQTGEHVTISNPPEGSTFHAVDTGEKYVYHNGGWVKELRT